MIYVLIVSGLLVVGLLIVLVATIPMVRKKEDAAIARTREALGGRDKIIMIDPKTTGMGFEPADTSNVRAMTCLAVTEDEVMAVSLSRLDEWKIKRSTITNVDTEASDPAAVQKASILITYTAATGDVVARFRVKDPVPWLTELGYDWGPDGPPEIDEPADDEDEDEDED